MIKVRSSRTMLALFTATRAAAAVSLSVILLGSCTAPRSMHDLDYVYAELERKSGGSAFEARTPDDPAPGISLQDGLTLAEAVGLALWHNERFTADLTTLGLARADLAQAGMLRNPVFVLLFPIGTKQLESSIAWSIDSVWKRPMRIDLARAEVEAAAQSLVQNGLILVRDVNEAFFLVLRSREELELAREAERLLAEVAEHELQIFAAGDTSAVEAGDASLRAIEATVERRSREAVLDDSLLRLRALLALPLSGEPLQLLIEGCDLSIEHLDLDHLITEGLAARPDLRVAELAIESSGTALGLARHDVIQLTAVIDANADGDSGWEAGPGINLELPVFDRGKGRIAKAEAELRRAAANYAALRRGIEVEIREAFAGWQAATELLATRSESLLPQRRKARDQIEHAYRAGDMVLNDVRRAELAVLEEARQVAVIREAARIARARLEQRVGRRLDVGPGMRVQR